MEEISIAVQIAKLFGTIVDRVNKLKESKRIKKEDKELLDAIAENLKDLKEKTILMSKMSNDVLGYKDLHEKVILLPHSLLLLRDYIGEAYEKETDMEKRRVFSKALNYSRTLMTDDDGMSRIMREYSCLDNDETLMNYKNPIHDNLSAIHGAIKVASISSSPQNLAAYLTMLIDVDDNIDMLIDYLDDKIKFISKNIKEVSDKIK